MPGAARKTFIAGYYGYGNAGDEAILAAMLRELRLSRPDLEMIVASGDPACTQASHGVQAVAQGDLQAVVAAMRESDLVILGGGGLFQDYWPVPAETLLTARQGGLPSYLSFLVLAALLGRPAMIYAAGVGPLATAEGRRLTRLAFELCHRATVRDPGSLALLAEIGLPAPDGPAIELAADPAFLLPPIAGLQVDALLAELGVAVQEPLIGVALRHWGFGVDPQEWEAAVARGLDLYLERSPGELLFVPFQRQEGEPYEDDLAVSRRVAGALRHAGRAHVVERRLRPEELAGVLGRCDRVLAMRFHAALLALAAGVPVAGLAYDPKVSSLMESAGVPGLGLPPGAWRPEPIAEALERAGEPDLRERLSGFTAAMRPLARRSAAVAIEALDAGPPVRSPSRRFLDELALAKALAALRLESEQADLRKLLELRESEQADLRRLLESRESEQADLRRLLESHESELAEERRLRSRRESELERLREDWEARGKSLETSWEAYRQIRDQRELLLQERNDLARRLTAFEATLIYQLGSRLWALMRRLFPEGSPRRVFYRKARALLGRAAGSPSPVPESAAAVPAGLPQPGEPDPRGDLFRFEDRVRESGAQRVVVLFSATQLLESEGQRPTSLALEFSRRGIPVVFVYWRWWPTEWCPQDRLEEGILQIPIDVVAARPEMIAGAFSGVASRVAMVEFPWPGFFETLAALNAEGWITLYDVLDDWEEFHRVGQAVWYDEPFERHVITAVDAVFAVNEPLAARIRGLGGERVGILSNGLKPGLEVVLEPRPLDRGEITVGYFGYLAGAWFDWELIAAAARRRPSWRFYLIGYGGSPEGVALPKNVFLLGKKPQRELAGYAANWDVAIIPFKPDRLAAGADPIKTYEYLAMGLPVVATGVYPPAGGEAFVTRAEGVESFLAALERATARQDGEEVAARRAFAASCTWGARLGFLLEALDRGEQRIAEKQALWRAAP